LIGGRTYNRKEEKKKKQIEPVWSFQRRWAAVARWNLGMAGGVSCCSA
jgi:hypothetical protein